MDQIENTNYRKNWKEHTGINIPEGMHLHHINGDTDDNTIDNLALVTQEGHARSHEAMGDTVSAPLIRQKWTKVESIDGVVDLLKEEVITPPTNRWEQRYTHFQHIPVEVLEVRRNESRKHNTYTIKNLITEEESDYKMADKFAHASPGQRHMIKGEKLNVMLSHEKGSYRVYLGISTLKKEYVA